MKRLKKKIKYSKKKVKFRKSLSKKRIKKKKISKRRGGSANNAGSELRKKRDSNFIISHIARLQQFYHKDKSTGIRSLCNFECSQKDKFKRILFPNNYKPYEDLVDAKKEDIVKRYQCLNHAKDAQITDGKYFETLKDGEQYFEQKYGEFFEAGELPIDDPEWKDIVGKVQDKMLSKTKVVLGPGELLGIFTKNGGFKALSHSNWSPNLNFNYILHVLYKYGEVILIIPKFNSVLPGNKETGSEVKVDLSSYCTSLNEKSPDEKWTRATMNELVLLVFLQDADLINIEVFSEKPETQNKITFKKEYSDVVSLLSEAYYSVKKDYTKIKTQNDCDIELPDNISKCGAVGIGGSKLPNGVPYKFQILHIKGTKGTEGFNARFKQYFEGQEIKLD